MHSSAFLPNFPNRFNEPDKAYRFAVVGNGQSAAEIAEYLLSHYRRATTHLFISDHTLRPPIIRRSSMNIFLGQSSGILRLSAREAGRPAQRTTANKLRRRRRRCAAEAVPDRLPR
ncbi:L-lysine 6-monooxygenase family protein [Mycobacterium xenopi 3993]|nr:L-lysine 6-monooxygenase family protein [Mycobacterium xenopi 3993]